jgi:hypothetical protein
MRNLDFTILTTGGGGRREEGRGKEGVREGVNSCRHDS